MKGRSLLFVSTRFLFPVDSGGKIRTTQILRGLRGGEFRVTLASPASDAQVRDYAAGIESVCDEFVRWGESGSGLLRAGARIAALLSRLPVPVATDRSARGQKIVAEQLGRDFDVVVFDFPHAAVLAPASLSTASVMFTHNVESEIFARHAGVSRWPMTALWRSQLRKMLEFERAALRRFDTVVAVSERDAQAFADGFGVDRIRVIGTGVDLDYFGYESPPASGKVVFTGSMDWLANQDGIGFLLDEVWPLVLADCPDAGMTVVGRQPPASLVSRARRSGFDWEFTGYVNDVRDYVRRASVYVIPLRVGGGTRLKVYEAMAMGCPVVSTSVGVEGLPIVPDEQFLCADSAAEIAAGIVRVLRDETLREALSRSARQYVEDNCSYAAVARQFERICVETMTVQND